MAEKVAVTKDQKELEKLKAENDILMKRCQLAEQRVNSLLEFAKASYETNADLLNQIDGALKSNRKLHNIGGQNLGQFIKALEAEKKNQ